MLVREHASSSIKVCKRKKNSLGDWTFREEGEEEPVTAVIFVEHFSFLRFV